MSNLQNLAESKRARQWSERMAGSAWQRAVVDMRLAGINPMLAIGQGPAATPGASVGRVDDPFTPAVHSGMAAARLRPEMQAVRAGIARTDAETGLLKSQQRGAELDNQRRVLDLSRARAGALRSDVLTSGMRAAMEFADRVNQGMIRGGSALIRGIQGGPAGVAASARELARGLISRVPRVGPNVTRRER